MDVTARRLGWSPEDGQPEYVSGELVILEAGEGGYAVHVVDGYTVDPETLEALQWAEQHPATRPETPGPTTSSQAASKGAAGGTSPARGDTTTLRPPSSAPRQDPPAAAR